ncbi:MAG TPA: c-type cytochrome domain-containing protein [Kofleriaceae bacterium]|nr:c-type cytochrome domain-containing protein [Kofleriaceae bacterium]
MVRMSRVIAALAALAGCPGGNDPPACVDVDLTCQPLYVPTFDNVYNNTLVDGCGSQRSACHSAAGHKGGMSFEDPTTAYNALRAGRIEPGNAACSEMIVRVTSTGTDYQMPPGSPLSAAEQCALIQWVQSGAPGPASAVVP